MGGNGDLITNKHRIRSQIAAGSKKREYQLGRRETRTGGGCGKFCTIGTRRRSSSGVEKKKTRLIGHQPPSPGNPVAGQPPLLL